MGTELPIDVRGLTDRRGPKFNEEMTNNMRTFWIEFLRDEQGQDLIEYTLVAALIGFAAVAGMGTLAGDINIAFSKIGSKLNASIS
jgi:pilus assembly protein Flp/PilA